MKRCRIHVVGRNLGYTKSENKSPAHVQGAVYHQDLHIKVPACKHCCLCVSELCQRIKERGGFINILRLTFGLLADGAVWNFIPWSPQGYEAGI